MTTEVHGDVDLDEGLQWLINPAPKLKAVVANAFRAVEMDNMTVLEFYFVPPTVNGPKTDLKEHSIKPLIRMGLTEHMAESVANTLLELINSMRDLRDAELAEKITPSDWNAPDRIED